MMDLLVRAPFRLLSGIEQALRVWSHVDRIWCSQCAGSTCKVVAQQRQAVLGYRLLTSRVQVRLLIAVIDTSTCGRLDVNSIGVPVCELCQHAVAPFAEASSDGEAGERLGEAICVSLYCAGHVYADSLQEHILMNSVNMRCNMHAAVPICSSVSMQLMSDVNVQLCRPWR
jgi:hypothetical protein